MEHKSAVNINNFGLSGYIDLPNAKSLSEGDLIISQQVHNTFKNKLIFQAFENLGLLPHGHGVGGGGAYGRVNHDRSFDAHLTLWEEKKYLPGVSLGLRDFIGTGWYSSEYIVLTKNWQFRNFIGSRLVDWLEQITLATLFLVSQNDLRTEKQIQLESEVR